MQAILALQQKHLQQRQDATHAEYIRDRQRDATIILSLHYSHSTGILFAGTHRGAIQLFQSFASLSTPSDGSSKQPLPPKASFAAHQGGVNCLDSSAEWLVSGGDDLIHLWSLTSLDKLGYLYTSVSPLHSITPAQYALPRGALTAVPRTLSVLMLPSSPLLVSSHSNQHALVTDLRTATTVADLSCSEQPTSAALSPSSPHSSPLSVLYLPEPYHVVLTGGADGLVRVFDCTKWRPTATYDVTSNSARAETAAKSTRPSILALSTASSRPNTASPASSLVLCLTADSTLHAFYYPALIALPSLLLTSPASLLHSSLLFTAAAVQRVHMEPLRVLDMRRREAAEGAVSACCLRYGERAAVDDVWFMGGSGGRIQMLGCMGSIDMGSLRC